MVYRYYWWRGGLVVECWTWLAIIRYGFYSHRGQLHNNLGQVVHTCVPLSPSSTINWYWSKDGDVLRLRRWPQAWRKVHVLTATAGDGLKSHLRVDWMYTGISSSLTLGNEYGKTFLPLPRYFDMRYIVVRTFLIRPISNLLHRLYPETIIILAYLIASFYSPMNRVSPQSKLCSNC